jgi:hypothetical protein
MVVLLADGGYQGYAYDQIRDWSIQELNEGPAAEQS